MAIRVNGEKLAEVLKSELPVLVEFYSESCIPCKQQGVILNEIEEIYQEKLKVVKVNVNFDLEAAEKYEVSSSPTILLFKAGDQIQRITGISKKDSLISYINQIVE